MNDSTDPIELAAEIVSAYVSNNSVPSSELPTLLNDVHAAIVRVALAPASRRRSGQAGRSAEEVDHQRLHHLSGRRPQVQVAEAASADPVQPVARGIPGEVGPPVRLSDGRAGLRQGAFGAGQADGPRPAAPSPEVKRTCAGGRGRPDGRRSRKAACLAICPRTLGGAAGRGLSFPAPRTPHFVPNMRSPASPRPGTI